MFITAIFCLYKAWKFHTRAKFRGVMSMDVRHMKKNVFKVLSWIEKSKYELCKSEVERKMPLPALSYVPYII